MACLPGEVGSIGRDGLSTGQIEVILTPRQLRSLVGVTAARSAMERTGRTPAGHRLWTPDDDSLLRQHWPQVDYLAGRLRRTATAVRSRARRLGLVKPRWTWSRSSAAQLRPRYPTNEPTARIAADLDRSIRQVWGKGNRMRLCRPRRPPKPVEDRLVHDIRQRAFVMHISLRELCEATRSGRYFYRPTKRRNWRAIFAAVQILGGQLELRS